MRALEVYGGKILVTFNTLIVKELKKEVEWFVYYDCKPDIIYKTKGDIHNFFRRGHQLKVKAGSNPEVNKRELVFFEEFKDYILLKTGIDFFPEDTGENKDIKDEDTDGYYEVTYNL